MMKQTYFNLNPLQNKNDVRFKSTDKHEKKSFEYFLQSFGLTSFVTTAL